MSTGTDYTGWIRRTWAGTKPACPLESTALHELQGLGGGHDVLGQGPSPRYLWSLLPCTNHRFSEVGTMSSERGPRTVYGVHDEGPSLPALSSVLSSVTVGFTR